MKKFSGANFCFWVSVLVGFFSGAVLPMFLLYYSFFRSRNCLGKILLMSGLVFLGFFLSSFGFFRRRRRPFVCLFPFSFEKKKLR